MADSSTTAGPILDLIAGGCWARRQLRAGIRYVSVASKLMNPPTFVRVVFLKVPELDGRFLHNCWTDSGSDCGRLLGSTPAMLRYRVHPPAIFIHEVTVLNEVLAILGLDGRFLYNRWTDSGSDCGRLLGSTPATRRYKVRPQAPILNGAIEARGGGGGRPRGRPGARGEAGRGSEFACLLDQY